MVELLNTKEEPVGLWSRHLSQSSSLKEGLAIKIITLALTTTKFFCHQWHQIWAITHLVEVVKTISGAINHLDQYRKEFKCIQCSRFRNLPWVFKASEMEVKTKIMLPLVRWTAEAPWKIGAYSFMETIQASIRSLKHYHLHPSSWCLRTKVAPEKGVFTTIQETERETILEWGLS